VSCTAGSRSSTAPSPRPTSCWRTGTELDMQELAREELGTLHTRGTDPAEPSADPRTIQTTTRTWISRSEKQEDEAALFARELFRTYIRLAERHRFKYETQSTSETGHEWTEGSSLESVGEARNPPGVSVSSAGTGNRVQRPYLHTSTVTVIVLPEVEGRRGSILIRDEVIFESTSIAHRATAGRASTPPTPAVRQPHLPTPNPNGRRFRTGPSE